MLVTLGSKGYKVVRITHSLFDWGVSYTSIHTIKKYFSV